MAKKLQVVPAGEFAQLVHDRLDGMTQADVKKVMKAVEAEAADCIAQGFGVTIGQLVKIEPKRKEALPKGRRFSPFDGETKMRPGKPAEVKVKAKALVAVKRDIPAPNTKAFKTLFEKLPKPKKAPKAKAKK